MRFIPKNSVIYRFYFSGVHFFAFCSVWLTFSDRLFSLFSLIILLSWYGHQENGVLLDHIEKKEWCVPNGQDEMISMELQFFSVMWRYLLILHFKGVHNNQRKTIVIFSDQLSQDDWRRLRRCVKVGYL